MSTDDPNTHENGRPKFDDVASLFGPIVPPPGTPVRARPASRKMGFQADPSGPAILAPPPSLAAPRPASDRVAPAPLVTPMDMALAEPDLPRVDRTTPRPLPARHEEPPERPRERSKAKAGGANVPWPDAFEPTPNYRRKPVSQYWAWLLVVPLLAVVAIGVFMVNPQTIRAFVDTHFPNLQHPATDTVNSLLPAPFRDSPAPANQPASESVPPPSQASPPTPEPEPKADAAPPAMPPSVEPGPPAVTPAPAAEAPAEPAPPVLSPVPPQAAPALPHAMPTPAPVAAPVAAPVVAPLSTSPAAEPPAISRVTVHYRRSEADGRRVAAQVDRLAGTVELRSGTSAYRSPTVVYYTPLDRDAATAVARTLGESWSVRAGPGRSTSGSLDLWLP